MRKTYLPRHSLFISPSRLSWGGVIVLLALLALLLRLLAPTVFWRLSAPAFTLSTAAAGQAHGFFAGFQNASRLALEKEQLARDAEALRAEVATLRTQLGDLGVLSGEGVVAGVVARPPQSAYDTLVVRVGPSEMLVVGMEAFGPGGAPLGVVRSVRGTFASIELFSAPGRETPGWVGERIPLVVRGDGGGALSVVLSRSAGVVVGDTVSVAGPGRLPLGVVASIDDDPSAPSIVAHLLPLSNPLTLSWVELRSTGAFAPIEFPATSTSPSI